MTIFDITVWTVEIGVLLRILWQGEILVRQGRKLVKSDAERMAMDTERLEMERVKHTRFLARDEEQTKWRQAKQKLMLKNLEKKANDSALNVEITSLELTKKDTVSANIVSGEDANDGETTILNKSKNCNENMTVLDNLNISKQ